jgi:hypothetical protein
MKPSRRLRPQAKPPSSSGPVVFVVVAAVAAGFFWWRSALPDEVAAPLNQVAAVVKGRRFSKLSERGGYIDLYRTPEGTWGRDFTLITASCHQGDPCEVVESITILGTRSYRVRAQGRLVESPELRAWLGLGMSLDSPNDMDRLARLNAIQITTVDGWTRWVADE